MTKEEILEILNIYKETVSGSNFPYDYAIYDHEFNELADVLVEKLTLPRVVGQSEQLGEYRCPPNERCKTICEECAMINGIIKA